MGLLATRSVRATFFVLGVTASEHPSWVRRIADAGHEIGTHGWSHTPIYRQSREQFGRELCRSLDTLQALSGQRVSGHRAALFSITRRSWWALAELLSAGLAYDSSIFPVHNYRYGIPGADRFPHKVTTPTPSAIFIPAPPEAGAQSARQGHGQALPLHPRQERGAGRSPRARTGEGQGGDARLWEFPIATLRLGGLNLPFGGGFYMRFLPYTLVCWAINSLNRKGQPAVVYFHPWEFDAQQPYVQRESYWLARATHYYRLSSTRETLRRLLNDFQWTTVRDYLKGLC